MSQDYTHLELEDRCSIARLHEGGQSIRQIAAPLDRSPSTVSRELKRDRGAKVGIPGGQAIERGAGRGCGKPASAVVSTQPTRVTRPVLLSMVKRAITDPSAVPKAKP